MSEDVVVIQVFHDLTEDNNSSIILHTTLIRSKCEQLSDDQNSVVLVNRKC